MECKNKCDTNKNTVNRKHRKIIHKVPEQHIWNARQQGSTENSHIGNGAHTSKNANVKAQNVYHGK